jgi:PTS system nitrogen regulatory IIA component
MGYVENAGEVLDIILERERQGGTTLGEGIAILHGRLPGSSEPAVALGILPKGQGITFGGRDDVPINIIYMVLSPKDKPELHLQVLAAIAKFLGDSDIRTRLRYAKNEREAMKIIEEHSKEKNVIQ